MRHAMRFSLILWIVFYIPYPAFRNPDSNILLSPYLPITLSLFFKSAFCILRSAFCHLAGPTFLWITPPASFNLFFNNPESFFVDSFSGT